MPPPIEDISDEESGDIPFDDKNGTTEDAKKPDQVDDENEEDDDEEEEENVFVVEKIVDHAWLDDGSFRLQVKWMGWEKPEDLTWEPEASLKTGAKAILDAYYKKIGGRPRKNAAKPATKPGPKPGPGRKRKSMGEAKKTSASAEPTEQKRRRKSSAPATEETPAETAAESEEDDLSWTPKGKDWGSQLEKVDTIIRDQDSKQLFAFLLWKNGKRSRVALETCYDRCPKQMLQFYENHLVFKET
ncbi:heterochromatin protein HP1 [Penicillium brasilianum]|uniref:Heterochromatin protein HP1 n=1 Tax=Penicillium brasilianum TaxID=104259 RepID=A0A1S9RFU7_PENBI|nr:heterochromatin protein HP1 [Penicillium brasilianum]